MFRVTVRVSAQESHGGGRLFNIGVVVEVARRADIGPFRTADRTMTGRYLLVSNARTAMIPPVIGTRSQNSPQDLGKRTAGVRHANCDESSREGSREG